MLRLNMMLMMIVATIQAVAIINTTDQDGQLFNIGQSSSATTSTTPTTNTLSSGNDETNQANVASQSTLPTNIDGIDSVVASCSIQPNRHIALLNQQNVDGHILMWQSSNQTGPLEMSLELTGFKVDCSHSSSSGGAQNPASNTTGCRTTILNADADQPSGPPQFNFTKAFGMHIHEGSDTTFGCQSVGNHYNPFNMTHGAPNDQIKHLGDLGNIYADHTGTVKMKLSFDDLSLFGNHSILNRAIVIHSGPDDYGKGNNPASKITGNSGIRIACCIIQLLQM